MATARNRSVAALVAEIDQARAGANLSSAIRVFVLEAVQNADRVAVDAA